MHSRVIYNTTRYLLGALFIFSGFAKGVNPFGLSLQFDSYFTAMGLDFLAPLGPFGAIVLPAGELWLGFLLIFGLAERLTRWAVGAMMLFFTGLTLWIALENPVADCGCFGELWKISNWATFWKNVLFLIAAVLFWYTTPASKPKRAGRLVFGLGLALLSLGLPLWCWYSLPLIETSPWAVGRDIGQQMRSSYVEETDTELVYRNLATGVEQKFSLSDTTWQDDMAWAYVRTESHVRSSGEKGALSQVVFIDPKVGDNVAPLVFGSPGRTVLVVLPDPRAMGVAQGERLAEVVQSARARMDSVLCLTSTPDVETPCGLAHLVVDRSLLYAMMPNWVGGVMVIENGVVGHKSAL